MSERRYIDFDWEVVSKRRCCHSWHRQRFETEAEALTALPEIAKLPSVLEVKLKHRTQRAVAERWETIDLG